MKQVLILGIGRQGQKYINYFQKNNYKITGWCKTIETKTEIEKKYDISVIRSIEQIQTLDIFDVVIVALPPDIQGTQAIKLLEAGYKNTMVIEIPVSWNRSEVTILEASANVYFFLEEYFTVLSKFLRKVDLRYIGKVNIIIYSSQKDYEDLDSRAVSYVHVNNNFLGMEELNIQYKFSFHDREDIFYKVSFLYKGTEVLYYFGIEKYLLIGAKKIADSYNFDTVVDQILAMKKNINYLYDEKITQGN